MIGDGKIASNGKMPSTAKEPLSIIKPFFYIFLMENGVSRNIMLAVVFACRGLKDVAPKKRVVKLWLSVFSVTPQVHSLVFSLVLFFSIGMTISVCQSFGVFHNFMLHHLTLS